MTSVAWGTVGAGRNGVAPGRPAWWIPFAIALLALGAGAAACFTSPALAVAALALPAAPLLFLAPDLAILGLIAVLPFDALTSLDDAGALALTRLLGIAVLGGWVLHAVANPWRRVRLGRPGLLLLAYVTFATVSIGWASDTDVTMTALRTLAQLFLLYVMAANVLDDWRRIARALDVLLLATTVLAVIVLAEAAGGVGRAVLRYGDYEVNPNFMAAQLAVPAAAALAFRARHASLGWWRLVAVVPIVLALIGTGSRGGALAFGAGLLTLAIGRPRLGARALAALGVVALLLPAMLPDNTLHVLRHRWEMAEDDRLSGRLDIWRVGLAMIADRPLQGTGFAGFKDAFYEYMLQTPVDPKFALLHSRGNRVAHNIYLSTVAELGLVGGALFGLALAAHARTLWQIRRAAIQVQDREAEDVALGLLAALVTLLVAGSCTELLLCKTPWLLLAMSQGAAIAAGWERT
jgi:O-antigen ligase